MGIFDKIKNAIWGEAEAAEPAKAPPAAASEAAKPAAAAPAAAPASAPAASAPAAAAPKPAAAQPAVADVDVAAVLDAAVARAGQPLDWRKSIVDLMKALGLDSSLAHRKELATELGYTGDMGDSAAMNIWLHKQVIQKLKENGGKVPADL
ncbi:DUF3597 domain-containing protein [Paracoccus sp. DMF-8]|uniref:DUF3597 domain-containing protein n=1 Tax=Paracoccus sp. DMF-8 TaxID=3019445 RepID=UPI0023E89F0B|nr:DUF3597 domain-containing protein [Paracoccus sp. DMF-8]MDF3605670.1 DUF3597 domain-containing protein [Paracoccus sp. DMF-8]